jgi:prevent-host-death family protein
LNPELEMSRIHLGEDVISLSEAKKHLHKVCERAVETGRSVLLTKHGRGWVALVPVGDFVAMTELRKELELERALRKALDEANRGEVRPVEEVEQRLSRYLDADEG